MELIESVDLQSRLGTKSGPIVLYGAGFFARLALFALQNQGCEVDYVCDSDKHKHGSDFCGFTVMDIKELPCSPDQAHIFITSIYIRPILESLLSAGFSNVYSCTGVFKSTDFSEASLDGDDTPETRTYGQSRNMINVQRQVELYASESLKISRPPDAALILKYVDIVVTEACSMKCIDCSNLMQYYHKPKHVDLDSLASDIETLENCVDGISEARVIGGEPLLVKKLHVVVNALLSHQKVRKVVIYTNGTIVPKGENLECLKDKRVFLDITNYGEHSRNLDRLKSVLDQNSVSYIAKVPTWTDSGRILPFQERSNTELKWLFQNCCNNDVLSLLHGRLYRCPFSAHATNLEAIPDDKRDWVDIRACHELEVIRNQINSLYHHKDYLTACSYCNGRDYTTPIIEAAIQTKRPLPVPEIKLPH